MDKMNRIQRIYQTLYETYGPQKWWPIINNKTLLGEYRGDAPKNDEERFEICIGAILAQNTSWYPGVVRALQQLKLGRLLTKKETEVLRQAEIRQGAILGNRIKQRTNNILTQNTAWKNVEKAIENLNRNNLLAIEKIKKADIKQIAKLIRPAGYYNQKAERLKIAAEYFSGHFKDKTIPTREELLKVKGIGPETADSILLYAFEQPYFVVDAYTKRIFSRLGFFKEDEKYDVVQKLFMDSSRGIKGKKKVDVFKEYHALIVEHAKRNCRKKAECLECITKKMCKNDK